MKIPMDRRDRNRARVRRREGRSVAATVEGFHKYARFWRTLDAAERSCLSACLSFASAKLGELAGACPGVGLLRKASVEG